MGKFAKWIGGGLGWAFFGPLGGFVGFLIGSAIDETTIESPEIYRRQTQKHTTTRGDYMLSLLVLVAAVLKADGKIMRSELNYTKAFFRRNFGEEAALEAIQMLKDLLKQNIPVTDVCHQIQNHMDYSSRLQLLHFLFGLAAADGDLADIELQLVNHIALHLGATQNDMDSIRAMFVPQTNWAYSVLEVQPTATDIEIKKAYKRMAVKYHPDKVSYLGEDVQKAAKEKFQKVSEAYETLKKERAFA